MDQPSNPYTPPSAALTGAETGENTSGMGKGHPIPAGVTGWSWGAFLLNWIWAIGNQTWIGLICLIPYVGFVWAFVLGFKGREWAWQAKHWDSVEHFNSVQRKWSMWGAILVGAMVALAIIGVVLAVILGATSGTSSGGGGG